MNGEKETHTDFLYKILKGIGHSEYVDVRSSLMINSVLKRVCKGADWLHVALGWCILACYCEDGGHLGLTD